MNSLSLCRALISSKLNENSNKNVSKIKWSWLPWSYRKTSGVEGREQLEQTCSISYFLTYFYRESNDVTIETYSTPLTTLLQVSGILPATHWQSGRSTRGEAETLLLLAQEQRRGWITTSFIPIFLRSVPPPRGLGKKEPRPAEIASSLMCKVESSKRECWLKRRGLTGLLCHLLSRLKWAENAAQRLNKSVHGAETQTCELLNYQ